MLLGTLILDDYLIYKTINDVIWCTSYPSMAVGLGVWGGAGEGGGGEHIRLPSPLKNDRNRIKSTFQRPTYVPA